VKPFKNGFLYYTMALPAGAHKTQSARGQACLGILCGNTDYRYSFGKQGDEVGAIVIKSPGVYHMGSYKLKSVRPASSSPASSRCCPPPTRRRGARCWKRS
jgi:hypothetical protein